MYLDIAGSAGDVKQSPRINGVVLEKVRDYSGQHKDDYKTTDSPFILLSAHNVRLVMLKRPLRKSNPAAAFLA
ncbi:hypothetical protein MC77_000120 [Citrobacter koseri]|nr:hypothetical protein MC77_000120 [Citrobacter koseri]